MDGREQRSRRSSPPRSSIDDSTPAQLAHPRQLAARVVARAALHRLDVAGQQLLEAERHARGRRRAGGVGAAHLARRRRRRPSRRRARRCARRARRGRATRPTRRVGWRVSARPQAGWRPLGGSSAPWSSSSSARTMRWRSRGVDRLRRPAAPRRRARRAAPPARARQLGLPALAHARRAAAGAASSSASAARRYRPVPPTTIGRAPAASSPSISAWASAAYSATREARVDRQERDEPVLEARALGAVGSPGEDLQPAVDLQRVGRDGDRLRAAARAGARRARSRRRSCRRPVGPKSASTWWRHGRSMGGRRRASIVRGR